MTKSSWMPVLASAACLWAAATAPTPAKEPHYQRLRVLLMTEKAQCVHCHTAADAADLNPYGKALADLGTAEPLSERMLLLDKEPPVDASDEERERHQRLRDVDGDGAANWLEMIAGANPGDAASRPDPALKERVERVVSCKACHIDTNLPRRDELESNPHNEFGKLLARTIDPRQARPAAGEADALRDAAARVPILRRISLTAKKSRRPGEATYWQKLLLLYAPADAATPSRDELRELVRFQTQQKNSRTRDKSRGLGPHQRDGLLADFK